MGTKIVMYGGTSRAEGLVRDVYWFNLEAKTWERASSAGKQGPGRTRHVAAAVGKYKIVIFGGRRQQTVLSDVHMLNSDSVKWSSPAVKGAPVPCEGAACCTIREKACIHLCLCHLALLHPACSPLSPFSLRRVWAATMARQRAHQPSPIDLAPSHRSTCSEAS